MDQIYRGTVNRGVKLADPLLPKKRPRTGRWHPDARNRLFHPSLTEFLNPLGMENAFDSPMRAPAKPAES